VRELMLLVPDADLSRHWQTRSEKTKNEAYELMQNIFLYAVDKSNLRSRGDTYIVTVDPTKKAASSVEVARITVGDNADPEPGGWRRLAAILNNENKLGLRSSRSRSATGKLAGSKVAHLTGTTKFTLNDAQKKELKDYVAAGGTLVVDAAGGAADFARSAERELRRSSAARPTRSAPSCRPPTTSTTCPTPRSSAVFYRNFARGKVGGSNAPRIRGIEQGGASASSTAARTCRPAWSASQWDGILGYSPDSATDIMRNIVLYAANIPAPATAPTTAPTTAPRRPRRRGVGQVSRAFASPS
jgi:hypothetical protein